MKWHLVFSMAFLAANVWGQDGAPVFRANADLALLDVDIIHNKTHSPAPQLDAQDFEVYEDGVPQKIQFFGRDQLPLSIVLLFDLTGSVHGMLHRLAGGAQTALDHLKPEDEVAVMVYAASARLVEGFTDNHAKTAAAIAQAASMTSGDAAFFNEAVYQAAVQLERSAQPSSRPVIVWLTDNLSDYPTDLRLRLYNRGLGGALPRTEEDAIHRLHESGTVVMPLLSTDRLHWWYAREIVRDRADWEREHPDQQDYSPGDAYRYAELSGGFAGSLRGKGVQAALTEVINSLRSRYTIGYRPAKDKPPGTFCRVQVALAPGAPLRPREWRVLTRTGYYRK